MLLSDLSLHCEVLHQDDFYKDHSTLPKVQVKDQEFFNWDSPDVIDHQAFTDAIRAKVDEMEVERRKALVRLVLTLVLLVLTLVLLISRLLSFAFPRTHALSILLLPFLRFYRPLPLPNPFFFSKVSFSSGMASFVPLFLTSNSFF
jgi:hypothetical protein